MMHDLIMYSNFIVLEYFSDLCWLKGLYNKFKQQKCFKTKYCLAFISTILVDFLPLYFLKLAYMLGLLGSL